MLIINRKIFLTYYICAGFFILFLAFSYVAYNNLALQSCGVDMQNLQPVIIIDAGHGGEDGGAVSQSGMLEKDVNLEISLKLKDLLIQGGFSVKSTRDTDISVCDSDISTVHGRKVSDLKNRLTMFNENKNNIVISIHQNKFTESKYSGTQIFYSGNNEKSSELAENIKTTVVSLLQPENTRECKKADKNIYLLDNCNVPSIIVECGFLSNQNEAALLAQDNYRRQIAYSIYLGFLQYYNKNY